MTIATKSRFIVRGKVLEILGVKRLNDDTQLLCFIIGEYHLYAEEYIIGFKRYLNGAAPTGLKSRLFEKQEEAQRIMEKAHVDLKKDIATLLKGGRKGFSVEEFCGLFNISEETAYRYIKQVPFMFVGEERGHSKRSKKLFNFQIVLTKFGWGF